MSKEKKPERKKRVPLYEKSVLQAEEREGYKRRWVNDDGPRIKNFLDAGYTFVQDPFATKIDKSSGIPSQMGSAVKTKVGQNLFAYLMEVPMEFYLEDQAIKQKRVDETEESFDPDHFAAKGMYGGVNKTRGLM